MQVREQAVDAVGHRRAGRATGLVARAEHEVVDEQLGSCIEELDQRLLAVVRVEAILLLHPPPGELASLPRELVAEPGVLLFADEQLLACGEPFFACPDVVISHFFSPSCRHGSLVWLAPVPASFCRSFIAASPVLTPRGSLRRARRSGARAPWPDQCASSPPSSRTSGRGRSPRPQSPPRRRCRRSA